MLPKKAGNFLFPFLLEPKGFLEGELGSGHRHEKSQLTAQRPCSLGNCWSQGLGGRFESLGADVKSFDPSNTLTFASRPSLCSPVLFKRLELGEEILTLPQSCCWQRALSHVPDSCHAWSAQQRLRWAGGGSLWSEDAGTGERWRWMQGAGSGGCRQSPGAMPCGDVQGCGIPALRADGLGVPLDAR